jgi:diguanylate cyclase (GGDEF)-like protein/PAS domain S-box-containing protein
MINSRNTILIVDDMEINRVILRGVFEKTYNLLEAENGDQAMLLIDQYHSSIACMLLDLVMPVKDGYAVMREMGSKGYLTEFPVIIITAEDSVENEVQAFDLGAADIVMKPFEPHVVKRRVQNVIDLNGQKLYQSEIIQEQSDMLRESNAAMVDALSSVIEYRSLETGQHIQRIRFFTKVLLEDVEKECPEYLLTDRQVQMISSAAAMHDIGKISIPDAILNKPGRLTPEEFAIMKTHALKGAEIISKFEMNGEEEYIQYAYNIAKYHHERWDGKGYPDGLKGDAIPLCAQIVGIADCYDALTNDRVYKKALPADQAYNMILNGECGTFSPKLMECFKNVMTSFMALTKQYADKKDVIESKIEDKAASPRSETILDNNFESLSITQMKYAALLKYINATVMEMDFSTGLYHIVYSSSEDFSKLKTHASIAEAISDFAASSVYPEDKSIVLSLFGTDLDHFFSEGLLRKSKEFRVFSKAIGDYIPCLATMMRIDLDNPHSKKAILLFKEYEARKDSSKSAFANDESDLAKVSIATLSCRKDNNLTILKESESLSRLSGYASKDISTLFHNRYIEMIHEDDRDNYLKESALQSKSGTAFEVEYRLNKKDGSFIWILDKTLFSLDQDGKEIEHKVIIDITKTRIIHDEMKSLMERYQMIMRQTNDVIFEWDGRTDTVSYSANFKDRFGYLPDSHDFTKRISVASHIYPNDLKLVQKVVEDISSGTPYAEIEIRIADRRGQYLWYRIKVSTQFDANKKLTKALGVITDIDEEKRTSQALKEKAERDSLTRLLNKSTARQKIEEVLAKRNEEEKAALMIMDVDNFKAVNDAFGHLFGDAVLQNIASELQNVFTNGEVVARIGGDEFMIFLPNVNSEGEVAEKAGKAIESIAVKLNQNLSEKKISVSAGISFCPKDGADYEDLFQKSDMALYSVKNSGKNSFAMFNLAKMNQPFGDYDVMAANTRIDSESIMNGEGGNEELSIAFKELYFAPDLYQAVSSLLASIGRQYGLSRTNILLDNMNGDAAESVSLWKNPAISNEDNREIKVIDYKDLDGFLDGFTDDGFFYSQDINKLPEKLAHFFFQHEIKSVLVLKLGFHGKREGLLFLSDCVIKRIWSKEQISAIMEIGQVLSVFLYNFHA